MFRHHSRRRRGSATVEAAFALPLILMLTFGTLDVCDGVFLKQKALLAAHEGARAAIIHDSTVGSIEDAVKLYLDERNLKYSTIGSVVKVSADPETVPLLETITVTVDLDLESNRRLPISIYQYVKGPVITASTTMYQEHDRSE